MKRFLKILLLSPMVFASVSCSSKAKEPTPVDVIVISGQSNGVGCTHSDCITRSIGYDEYDKYLSGYPEIQIAYDCWTKDQDPQTLKPFFYSQNKRQDGGFYKVMLGQGNYEGTFGPEIGIAEATHENHAGKLFLIKYACGASNLKDDWAKKDSPMYGRFVKFVKDKMQLLKDMGYVPTIKAMCWMQGEGDSYEGYYQEYYENTKQFVGNLREEFKELSGNKDFPFIDAGINNSKDPSSGALLWQYYEEVNAAKKRFADESDNNFYIDTIAAGLHTDKEPFNKPDAAHYDSESQVQLGKLFAQAFEQFLIPPKD